MAKEKTSGEKEKSQEETKEKKEKTEKKSRAKKIEKEETVTPGESESKTVTEEPPKETEPEKVTDAITEESSAHAQNFEFQSEVKQLLHILVFSLYKHKEVFLRELISNAVDALNKVQFESLMNSDIEDKELDFRIDISIDRDKYKVIIEDTGIGMNQEELIENIGTIAHSGTLDFVKKVTQTESKDKMDLIGQFGVGFYSSFMVADEIHVHTKSYKKGSMGYLWKSKGGNTFTIEEKGKKNRGTRIELFLKEDEKEFGKAERLKTIIKEHSKFVPFPIYVEGERIESVDAIWTQPKSKLQEKDYNEFYRFFQNANEDCETYLHLSSDAPVQFNSIMYVPKNNSEIYGWVKSDPGIDLYSKKVLISKHCRDLIPEYFRFMKGVVDSEDIPLNISRETIQSDLKVSKIRKHVLKKIYEQFADIKNKDMDKYLRIWKNFGRNFKEGVPNEYEYRDQLAALLLFHSSKTPKEQYTDLDKYCERMPQDQWEIYYAIGHDYDSIERNPALEAFKKKDMEVLYFVDPMDGWVMDHLQQYKGKMIRPVEAADISIDENEKEKETDTTKEAENLASYLKTIFGDRIEEVRISHRLVDSPCILVNSKNAPSIQLERMMRMQNAKADFSKKILEINPKNNLIIEMTRIHKTKPDSEALKALGFQLLDNMILREGVTEEIEHIIPRIHDIMLKAAQSA
jgi:HSP90 family molecular chaperone